MANDPEQADIPGGDIPYRCLVFANVDGVPEGMTAVQLLENFGNEHDICCDPDRTYFSPGTVGLADDTGTRHITTDRHQFRWADIEKVKPKR